MTPVPFSNTNINFSRLLCPSFLRSVCPCQAFLTERLWGFDLSRLWVWDSARLHNLGQNSWPNSSNCLMPHADLVKIVHLVEILVEAYYNINSSWKFSFRRLGTFFVYLSVCLYVSLSLRMSIFQSVCRYLYMSAFPSHSVCLFFFLPACPVSLCLLVWLTHCF